MQDLSDALRECKREDAENGKPEAHVFADLHHDHDNEQGSEEFECKMCDEWPWSRPCVASQPAMSITFAAALPSALHMCIKRYKTLACGENSK